jgi:hypothetical protein
MRLYLQNSAPGAAKSNVIAPRSAEGAVLGLGSGSV